MTVEISMDKKYRTRNGGQVRLLCVDRDDPDYPVVALVRPPGSLVEESRIYMSNGHYYRSESMCPQDLVEISPYDDLPIDSVVDLYRLDKSYMGRYHFAGLRKSDNALRVWCEGRSSHTKRDEHDTMVVSAACRMEIIKRMEQS